MHSVMGVMSSGRASAWNLFAHPVIAADSMADSSVVEHSLLCSTILGSEAALVQLAFAISNPLILLFTLWKISYNSS
jgi:hypothetical protein